MRELNITGALTDRLKLYWKKAHSNQAKPVACHNKPCYWPSDPHRPEIQVTSVTDGNHSPRGVDKARGWSVWAN